jgi:uncharacterized protein
MTVGPLPVVDARHSAFSYQCRACSRCCYGRRIQVNPYELARLARGLGITTTEVISRFTTDGGTALATHADTSCTFLGPDGCTVHPDRPLVCRLYPLGRLVNADGYETFITNEPHPQTEGLYGTDGTVDSFLESQSVAPYIAAADRYFAVYAQLTSGSSEPRDEGSLDIDPRAFIDADLAVETNSSSANTRTLTDVDALVDAHLVIIERWARELG